jgi:hypothetical protein
LVRPKVDFDGFESISEDYSDNFFDLLVVSHFLNTIIGLFLNVFHNSDDVHHLILYVVVLVLPVIVLLTEFTSSLIFSQKMKAIILFS